MIMSELINDFNHACVFLFVFVSVWLLLLASLDTSISYNQNQYVHIDSSTNNRRKYYFCYCHNGRKDKVIHMMEVSKKTFDNCTVYHDSNEIVHIGRNKVYLDASRCGESFGRLPNKTIN